jgi:ubiquitin fusion degradation protein 1
LAQKSKCISSYSYKFVSFISLDGKQKKSSDPEPPSKVAVSYQRGIPDYDYQIGSLRFLRFAKPSDIKEKESEASQFQAFSGSGQSLRQTKERK